MSILFINMHMSIKGFGLLGFVISEEMKTNAKLTTVLSAWSLQGDCYKNVDYKCIFNFEILIHRITQMS